MYTYVSIVQQVGGLTLQPQDVGYQFWPIFLFCFVQAKCNTERFFIYTVSTFICSNLKLIMRDTCGQSNLFLVLSLHVLYAS